MPDIYEVEVGGETYEVEADSPESAFDLAKYWVENQPKPRKQSIFEIMGPGGRGSFGGDPETVGMRAEAALAGLSIVPGMGSTVGGLVSAAKAGLRPLARRLGMTAVQGSVMGAVDAAAAATPIPIIGNRDPKKAFLEGFAVGGNARVAGPFMRFAMRKRILQRLGREIFGLNDEAAAAVAKEVAAKTARMETLPPHIAHQLSEEAAARLARRQAAKVSRMGPEVRAAFEVTPRPVGQASGPIGVASPRATTRPMSSTESIRGAPGSVSRPAVPTPAPAPSGPVPKGTSPYSNLSQDEMVDLARFLRRSSATERKALQDWLKTQSPEMAKQIRELLKTGHSKMAPIAEKSRGATSLKPAISAPSSKNLLDRAVRESQEGLKHAIRQVDEAGNLKTVQQGRSLSKSGYEYRDIIDDYLNGVEINPRTEYVLNYSKMKDLARRLRERAERQLAQEIAP